MCKITTNKDFDIIKITKAGFYCKSREKYELYTKFNTIFQFNDSEEEFTIEGIVVEMRDNITDKEFPYILTVFLLNFDPLIKEKFEKSLSEALDEYDEGKKS